MNHEIIVICVVIIALFAVVPAATLPKFRHVFRVPEGWAGLLYRDGLYVRRHNAGRKVVWGFGWAMVLVDLRRASFPVTGQEVLTADHISLKLGLFVTYQVADPVVAAHSTQHWLGDLQNAAQLALRTVAGDVVVVALLNQRREIGARLLARTQPEAARIGVHVLAVEVKDVILPTELKRAFADLLRAGPAGPTASERPRGEGDWLRNLANAS